MAGVVPYADKKRKHSGATLGGSWQAIAPSNSTVLTPRPQAILVNATGTLILADADGDIVIITIATAPQIVPLSPASVCTSGTDAIGNVATSAYTTVYALF